MPKILEADMCEVLTKKFSVLSRDVTLLYVPKAGDAEDEVGSMLSDLSELSPKIRVERMAPEQAQVLGIADGPVMVFKSDSIKGDARYYGTPAGYEFSTLVEFIIMVGGPVPDSGHIAQYAKTLTKPLKLEVFVTTGCPYCPTSAFVALKLALLSPLATGYVYDAPEFPEVSRKYGIKGVPKTVINDGQAEYMGGQAEDAAVLILKKALEAPAEPVL